MGHGKTFLGHWASRRTGDHRGPTHTHFPASPATLQLDFKLRACPLMRARCMRENTGRETHSDFHGMQNWQEPEQQWLFNSKLDTARREEAQPTRQTSKAVVPMWLP